MPCPCDDENRPERGSAVGRRGRDRQSWLYERHGHLHQKTAAGGDGHSQEFSSQEVRRPGAIARSLSGTSPRTTRDDNYIVAPKSRCIARRPESVSRTVRLRRSRSAQPRVKKVSAMAAPSAPEMCGRRSLQSRHWRADGTRGGPRPPPPLAPRPPRAQLPLAPAPL